MRKTPLLLLIVCQSVFAQYNEPSAPSDDWPPGCQAAFYYANYCVSTGIIPMGANLDMPPQQLAREGITRENVTQSTIQCLQAATNWLSCDRYLRHANNNNDTCKDYWKNPAFSGTSAVDQERLRFRTAECGGANTSGY